MKIKSIKAACCFIFGAMAAFSLQANNQISWKVVTDISSDSDVNTSGTLVGTYAPYLILNPGVNSLTVNGVTFESNSVDAVTIGVTNSVNMGINANLSDPNYADLLSAASDSTFDGSWSLTISNLIVGDTYQVQIWAENVDEPSYDQWENLYTISSSSASSAVNYDNNGNKTGSGIGEYAIGTFTATNSSVQITSASSEWSEVWGSGTINHASGQGQINLLALRIVGTPPPQNQITWGSVTQISADTDVVTNGLLIGTYSPYLILNPGVSSLMVNGITFQSNTLNAVTFGMTNSASMGINVNLSDPNYADLLSGASDTPFDTSGLGYILFSNVVPGNEYEVQIWAENINEPTYDQWENLYAESSSDSSGPVNYANNGNSSGDGVGEYVTGTFIPTASNSVVEIQWNEWSSVWGSGVVNSASGQGQINLLDLLLLENPPTVTTQPAGLSYVASGGDLTLTATASGSPIIAYQWYETNLTAQTGSILTGQTNASLTVSNLTSSTDYYLVVTNQYGSTNSIFADVVVYQSPLIISQLPVAYTNPFTLYSGANPSFSVTALGLTTLGYRWFTNGTLDGAATSETLQMADVQAGAFTNYCIVTNSYGAATSVVWSASVIADPLNSSGGLAPYPQAVLALNPIGYWRLNEPDCCGGESGPNDDDIAHDYAGGNDGVYTNMSLGWQGYNSLTDPSDTSAQFGLVDQNNDGGDSEANSIAGMNFEAPSGASVAFTVEAWVNGYAQTTDAGLVTLGWGGGGEQYNMDCGSDGSPTSHGFRFFIRDAAGNTHGVSSTVEPIYGTWYHLAAVVDEISNQEVTFYINGQSVGTGSVASGSGILSSTNMLGIGSRMSSATTNFDDQFVGNINDVAIFNYALSAVQVAGEYAAGVNNLAPFFVPTPETSASGNMGSPLTIPVTAFGTGPLNYEWINTNTSVVVASGTTSGSTLNASFATNSAPASWNNQGLELIVSNAYGSTNALVTLSIAQVNTTPTNIVFEVSNNQVHLSWPVDHTGWMLQAQTNSLSVGISTNWVNVNGSTTNNQVAIPLNLTNGSVFYRLVYP